MACVIVPMLLAGVTTSIRNKVPERLHVKWLNMMLWGGAAGLALEHVAHGEITPFPPFLTAMKTAADTTVMLREMATTGIAMTLAIVGIWAAGVAIHGWFNARAVRSSANTV